MNELIGRPDSTQSKKIALSILGRWRSILISWASIGVQCFVYILPLDILLLIKHILLARQMISKIGLVTCPSRTQQSIPARSDYSRWKAVQYCLARSQVIESHYFQCSPWPPSKVLPPWTIWTTNKQEYYLYIFLPFLLYYLPWPWVWGDTTSLKLSQNLPLSLLSSV